MSNVNSEIISFLEKNKKEQYVKFKDTYERNRIALNSYKLWRYGKLPSFEKLTIECIHLSDEYFTYLDKNKKCFGSVIEVKRTSEITRQFFQNLEKPILDEEEYNVHHYEYLYDNVRRSEDYGDDNHIYMCYHDINCFIVFCCLEDITLYLMGDKFVFIFGDGDKKKFYPINWREEYGIDYKESASRTIRVDEIKRLIVQWQSPGYSGGTFLAQVCDYHPNMLTVPELAMSEFDYLYNDILKGKDVLSAFVALQSNKDVHIEKQLKQLFNEKAKDRPSMKSVFNVINSLFYDGYVPKRKEWFVAIYLAYAIALKRDLNKRITPAIFFSTHPISRHVPICKYYDIFREFKYLYGIEIIRRPSISLASRFDTLLCHPQLSKNHKTMIADLVIRLKNFLGERKTDEATSVGSCFSDEGHEFLLTRRIVRFEDLKIYPKATLMSMVRFFDVPYDDMLMHTSNNGVDVGHTLRGAGSTVRGYDTAPVHNLHENGFNKFDHFRIEVLLGKRYDAYGYKPLFWNGEVYTEEEIIDLFKVGFKFEKHFDSVVALEDIIENRKILMDLVKEVLSASNGMAINGRRYVAIPIIKPDSEIIAKDLFNMKA